MLIVDQLFNFIMDRLYHGCMLKNADGTNRIIDAGEKCLVMARKCFWKDPSEVKTRSQTENEPNIDYKMFDNYHVKREWID